ncbi:FAD-dependent oxidoreductase [Streptomyces sp. NPDC060048]|uniref:FAD-dependent oxidoreductase n=1 Tax=unclassified Streptomyces TaxID=2593676 RepID=UPI003692A33F
MFERLDAAREEGRRGRVEADSVTVYEGTARFTGPRELRIDLPDGAVDISARQLRRDRRGGGTLLGPQDETVAERFDELARTRYDLRLGREVTAVGGRPGALRLTLDDAPTVEADMLLVAAGRVPDSGRLNLDAAGIAVRDDGRIVVDAYQRITAEGAFALGDISTPPPLEHMANREAQVVAHNLRHPDDLISAEHELVPAAVFITRPEIATVGA